MEGNGGWDSPIWVKSSRGMFIGKTLYHIRVCVFFSLGSWHCWNIRSFDSNVQALVLILRWRFSGYCFVVSSAIDTLLRLSETSPNTSLVYGLNPSYKRALFNYTSQHKLHFIFAKMLGWRMVIPPFLDVMCYWNTNSSEQVVLVTCEDV
jgi:hypothetical protein